MTLLLKAESNQRHEQKTLGVLAFLSTTVYSNAQILGLVMQVNARSGIYRLLSQLETRDLIRRELVPISATRSIPIWGITQFGQAVIAAGREPLPYIFNVAKLSVTNLNHYLGIQALHIQAAKNGWTEWQYCDRGRARKMFGDIRPDALVRNPLGQTVAVEYERTLKSLRRYTEDIIPSHLRNIHAGVYNHVLWVSPTHQQHILQLETIRKAVDELTAQKRFFIDRNIVKGKVFYFTSAVEFPQYEALSTR